MTDNALDPPPARRPRASRRRIALILVGVVIAAGVTFTIGKVVFFHPAQNGPGGFDRAAFARSSGPAPTPPPAVSPETAEKTKADIAALHRAASSPALEPKPVQVATVSPPAGPVASGLGVNRSRSQIGPSDG
jgi:hypothetical protein